MPEFIRKYDYQEIMVEELSQIYKIIKEYNLFHDLPRQGRGDPEDKKTYRQAFYRGQSDSSWQITPSIYRNKSVDERISEDGELLFEMMAYKQHYIQATRLIDFTTNIDVALYFACNENFDKDAAVFLWSYSPSDSTWINTRIQCELVNVKKERISICEFSKMLFDKYPELRNMYSYEKDFYRAIASYLDHGFMIMPPSNPQVENLRIQRQKGCLYVCGVKFETPIDEMRTSVDAGDNILYPHKVVFPCMLVRENSWVKVIIPSRLKKVILKHLEGKGITEEFLLPE